MGQEFKVTGTASERERERERHTVTRFFSAFLCVLFWGEHELKHPHVSLHQTSQFKSSLPQERCSTHLAELRKVVLLAEGTLPQPRLVISDGLVIALTLWASVSNAGNIADDQLSWRKEGRVREGRADSFPLPC